MTVKIFHVGEKVRLTGAFLRSTGQRVGGDGQARWTVQAYHPVAGGRSAMVLTDALRLDDGTFTPAEISADPTLKYRRINAANLEKCR